MIKVSAFRWMPPFARGLVRDLRVRWALEEAGLLYQARLIGPDDQKSKSYRTMQPDKCRPSRTTILSYSNPEPSCCTLPSGRTC
jgi:hypothetical protein